MTSEEKKRATLARIAAWQKANPERVKASRRKYRTKNRERVLASAREYARKRYAEHPELVKAANAKSKAAHREEIKARARARYAANREKANAKCAAYYRVHRRERSAYAAALRVKRKALFYIGGCVDAGSHNGQLEFHHRDPSTKLFSIASGLHLPVAVIRAEIKKCDLVCDRHHQERHRQLRRTAA